MITFKYVARDSSGNLLEGFTEAISEADVLSRLRDQGCTPVVVEPTYDKPKRKVAKALPGRISAAELASVFWQLNAMV